MGLIDIRKSYLLTMLIAILFAGAVFAIPGIPHQFYGNVLVNGAPAGDGTTIVVKIDGAIVATTTTSGGRYGYSPNIFYVEDPNGNREGKTIYFYVSNVEAATATFHNGASTRLDLSVTVTTPPGGGDGGGGGGGGGGGIPPVQNITQNRTATSPTCSISYDFTLTKNEFSAKPNGMVTVPITINMKEDCGAPRDLQFDLESPWINFTKLERLVAEGERKTSLFFQVAEDAALGDYAGTISSAGIERAFTVHVVEELPETEQPEQQAPPGLGITGFFAGIGTDPVVTGAVVVIIIIILVIVYYFLKHSTKKKIQKEIAATKVKKK